MNSPESNRIPRHVAIIMDGNGRWAEQRGLDRIEGHIKGVESVRKVIKAAVAAGVEYLTMYAFSTENWGRPKKETDALMELLCENAVKESPELRKQGVKLNFIGDLENMSDKVRTAVAKSENETSGDNIKTTLTLAVNYSSRWETARMVKQIAEEAKTGRIETDEIDDDIIRQHLTTASMPDPDMLIRTSGEIRLSNFLLWQIAYSELYFTDVYWPDFDEAEFDKALLEYAKRERRYGLLTKVD